MAQPTIVIEPDLAAHARYLELLAEYLEATELLTPLSHRLAARQLGSDASCRLTVSTTTSSFRSLSGEQRELLMIQVGKRYYELDMTMGELAKELGLTRWQASRLLTDARESRHRAHRDRAARAAQPRHREPPAAPLRPEGGRGGAAAPATRTRACCSTASRRRPRAFIAGLGQVPLIGVSWGRTMSAVAHRLPPFWNEGVEVVLLNGAMNIRSPSIRTNNTAELFARSANGTATLLPVPAILGHAATRVALEQDPTIASVLTLGRRAPVICFGMGGDRPGFGAGAVRLRHRGREQAALQGQGRGRRHSQPLYRRPRARSSMPSSTPRTIGLDLRYCAGARILDRRRGRASRSTPIALACLRARYFNVLVTDEQTARFLLDEAHHG